MHRTTSLWGHLKPVMSQIKRVIISGGDFTKTGGCLSIVEVNESARTLVLESQFWLDHPRPHIAIVGKGITGACLASNGAWVCFSNLLAHVNLFTQQITDIIEDALFSDLHQLDLCHGQLVIANTGNESIDFVSLDQRTIHRFDLLGSTLRSQRPPVAQNRDTEPHLYHLAGATLNADGELLAAFGRHGRLMNVSNWSWIGPQMGRLVHDLQCSVDGSVWCTSVDGHIYKVNRAVKVDTWSIRDFQPSLGWTRGLTLLDQGMLVGTTAIRKGNRDYFQSQTTIAAQDAPSCITYVPYAGGAGVTLEWPQASSAKIFSIRQLPCEVASPPRGD